MIEFIQWLEKVSKTDTKVKAILRCSLCTSPGTYVPAWNYVEWAVCNKSFWERKVYYLVAGLWAQHDQKGIEPGLKIGEAFGQLYKVKGSKSLESRFMSLIDADDEQLFHSMRQIINLLKDYQLDFEYILKGLSYWNYDNNYTKMNWARDFYNHVTVTMDEPDEEEIDDTDENTN